MNQQLNKDATAFTTIPLINRINDGRIIYRPGRTRPTTHRSMENAIVSCRLCIGKGEGLMETEKRWLQLSDI
jgi:hypothetical protein